MMRTLAASAAAAVAAASLGGGMSGGGHGMWAALKNWIHGSGIVDLRPSQADSCCAMHRDGSYYANITALADLGNGMVPSFGSFGANAAANCYASMLGGTDVESSDFGMYLRPVDGIMKLTVWCSEGQACKDFDFPQGHTLPKMCFGDGSLWPQYYSSSRIDAMLSANNFVSEDGNHFISTNRITCMPLYSVHRFNGSDNISPAALLSSLLPAAANAKAGDDDESWAAVLFLNATGTPPPDDFFGLPSYCSDSA